MGRPLCFALGLTVFLFGAECLLLEKAVLKSRNAPDFDPIQYFGLNALTGSESPMGSNREFVPKEWMPWTFMGAGAVAMIYTCTLGKTSG